MTTKENAKNTLPRYYAWGVEETKRAKKMVCLDADDIIDIIRWTQKRRKRLQGKPIYVTRQSPQTVGEWKLCAVLEPIQGKYKAFMYSVVEKKFLLMTDRYIAELFWDYRHGWEDCREWMKHYFVTDSIRYVHL